MLWCWSFIVITIVSSFESSDFDFYVNKKIGKGDWEKVKNIKNADVE